MRAIAAITTLLALFGCAPRDVDGDGFEAGEDCDDADARINPRAIEVCDGIDQDCDGSIDENATDALTFYSDRDGDGYGLGSPFFGCEPPSERWAQVRGDCDDRDAEISPAAEETCDQRDQDCDGEVDEGFVCGEIQCDDGIDDDLDGATDCEDPDCDGACPETCDDGRDNDANGDIDCADAACWGVGGCVETDCTDGSDDEADGLTDCDDPDCWSDTRCPSAAWRITGGSLAVSRETVSWTERGCDGRDCERGVDRVQDIQAFAVTGELLRELEGSIQTCAFAYDKGRFFSRFEAGSYVEEQISRESFTIEPGCGVSDSRFLPRRLILGEDGVQTTDGALWFVGDRFEESRRESDLEDPLRSGQVVRDQAFWDPLRPATPMGACRGSDLRIYFDDVDLDGVGAIGVGRMSCDTEGLPTDGTDCDDEDRTLPAGTEICGNGIDDDCDGTAPTCDGPGGEASLGEPDGRWRGSESAGILRVFEVGDLDGDGIAELAIGTPAEDEAGEDAGGVRLWFDGLAYAGLDEGVWLPGAAPGDLAGSAVVNIGDHTGDGLADLLITAPGVVTDGETRSGAAYVLAAPFDRADLARPHARITGPGLWLGTTAASLGDGDGMSAVAIGAQTDAAGGANAGSVRIFAGPLSGDMLPGEADAVLVGKRNDIIGHAIAGPGDVDGDGLADLLIGRRKGGATASEAGAAHLWLAPFPASADVDEADASWDGELADAWAGERVSAAGDVDGDGYRDLLVAAPRTWGVAPREIAATGEIYLIAGSARPEGGDLRAVTAVIRGDRIYDVAGASLAGGRDLDGDGLDDIAIGAPGDDRRGAQAGVVAVFSGPIEGQLRLADATGLYRGEAGTQAGLWVSLVGDLDGDGLSELVTSSLSPDGESSGQVLAVLGGRGW